MTWVEYHKQSEQFAGEAEAASYQGDADCARELYRKAAELEEQALNVLDRQKIKTLGITAISAAALWYKAGRFQQARKIAEEWLAHDELPAFAVAQLNDLLKSLRSNRSSGFSNHSGLMTEASELSQKISFVDHYQVHISWDSDSQAFLAQAMELPGCVADGVTRLEAVANLAVAVEEWVQTAKELNRPIPQPEEHSLFA